MKRKPLTPYTVLDELMASDSSPTAAENRAHQLSRMRQGLSDMMHAPQPSNDAWRVLSDAVNLLETLVQEGEAPQRDAAGRIVASHWRGCDGAPVEVRDSSGLLLDAITALAHAGERALHGKPMRLDGPGLVAVRAVLEDYQAALECLPARTMIRCHRKTATRMRKVLNRIGHLPDGVHVMAI